jgi:hypothetical protein
MYQSEDSQVQITSKLPFQSYTVGEVDFWIFWIFIFRQVNFDFQKEFQDQSITVFFLCFHVLYAEMSFWGPNKEKVLGN